MSHPGRAVDIGWVACQAAADDPVLCDIDGDGDGKSVSSTKS